MPGGQFSLKNIITEIAILWKHFFPRGGGAGGGGYFTWGSHTIMTGESVVKL